MRNILDKDALQKLLRCNWSTFIHKNRLVAFVLQQVRDAEFPISLGVTVKVNTGLKLSISRIEPQRDGFLLWIEFTVPDSVRKAHIGTCEAMLSYDGTIRPINLIGETVSQH
jgi:hypothetical protein